MSALLEGLEGTALQGSLFDAAYTPMLRPLDALSRTALDNGAWVEHRTGWLAGGDALFDSLHTAVPWKAERREMYQFYESGEALPHPILRNAMDVLTDLYRTELGEPFVSAGLCLYRDGRDSVAWHGDRIGRARDQDTMVAILSIGSARSLMLRPRGGGRSVRHSLGHGDLIVMGGSCQRTWDHCIPKTNRPVGPRISIQFRPLGIR